MSLTDTVTTTVAKVLKTRVTLRLFIALFGSAACALTALGFADRLWWRLDNFSHFRFQYLAALLVASAAALALRRWRLAAVFAPFIAANLAVILPLYLAGPRIPVAGGRPFRVVLVNVNTSNPRHDRAVDFLLKSGADVILLEEVDDRWLVSLDALKPSYRFRISDSRSDNFGVAILSRTPLIEPRIIYLGGADVPSVLAKVDVAGIRLSVLGTHPLPPGSARYIRMRNQQLDLVAAFARATAGPLVVCGDLNATPWCAAFRRFVRVSRLCDSAKGRGSINTWPTTLPPMRIPIDHCLHTSDLAVVSRSRGPSIGSDHFPLIVDLAPAAWLVRQPDPPYPPSRMPPTLPRR